MLQNLYYYLIDLLGSHTAALLVYTIIIFIIYILLLIVILNIDKLLAILLTITYFINIWLENIVSYLAKTVYSEIHYIIYYNNYLKRHGLNIRLVEMDKTLKTFSYLSSRFNHKYDLCSVFMFIYSQIKYTPLRFFVERNTIIELEVIFKYPDSEKRYLLEYNLSLEDDNYFTNKIKEISNLDILNNYNKTSPYYLVLNLSLK